MRSKLRILILVLLIGYIPNVYATRGCCSHHGGVAGCSSNGRQICRDGTYSPTCTCTPTYTYGCTDPNANNYNSNANRDNGSCKYDIYGCINSTATNYNKEANKSDGSCLFEKKITEEVEINYEVEYKENQNLEYNKEKIAQKGENGTKQLIYIIIVNESNQEVSRELIEEKIIKKSQNKIIERNTTNHQNNESNSKEIQNNKENINNDIDDEEVYIGILIYLIFIVIYIILITFNLNYIYKTKTKYTLLAKIKENPILCVIYYLSFIPTYIDFVIIILKKQKLSD